MEKKERFIKISENKIFITPNDSISFHKTNFPENCFGFKSNKEIYWQIELNNYNKVDNSIDIIVLDYHPSNYQSFYNQTQKSPVEYLKFEPLEWRKLEPFLAWYKAIAFKELTDYNSGTQQLKNINKAPSNSTKSLGSDKVEKYTRVRNTGDTNTKSLIIEEPTTWEHELNFKFYFKDAKFNDGYVSFEKYVDSFNRYIDFKIYNNQILAEYDFIKFYFPKVYNNLKKFSVSAKVIFKGNKINEVIANSKEIESIDDKLIDRIKKHKIRKITNLHLNDKSDKNLFTVDDLNSQINNFNNEDYLNENELEIIQLILSQKDIRNKKQLQFLSGLKQTPTEKILFTLKPLFGFLFFIEGKSKNHFCWELLDTHATYVWSLDKLDSQKNQITRIEECIDLIKNIGRNNYKTNYTKNLIDSDISFNTVNHSDSIDKNGFIDWKNKLNEVLI